MEFLWPDSDPESTANNLHKAIHMARRALEPVLQSAADSHFIITQGQQISLRAPGKMWIDKRAGLFRWQVGEPPELLAVRGKDGGMTVLDARQKLARVWSKEALEAEDRQGRGQGFAMLSTMHNATLADFDRDFELAGIGFLRRDVLQP